MIFQLRMQFIDDYRELMPQENVKFRVEPLITLSLLGT